MERFGLRVISGEARGVGPTLLRGALSLASPFYAAAMIARNRLFNVGAFKEHRLSRRVISVGNLTAGGTGKTPVVRWLADQLRTRGWQPAVLLRGYEKRGATFSDEERLLQDYLTGMAVVANPNRLDGAREALDKRPGTDLILLDDGFQHRRVARDVDLVLINAAEPFGFGYVHPRGLLREPLGGLRRATAVILTRCDAVEPRELEWIERVVRSIKPQIPIFRTIHEMTGLRRAGTLASDTIDEPLDWIKGRPLFSFSGIGSPKTFHDQLARAGGKSAGSRAFPDHHEYDASDLAALSRDAAAAGADVLLTTEKDWVKLSRLAGARETNPPILRVEVRIRFQQPDDEVRLLDLVEQRITPRLADEDPLTL